MKHTVLIFIVLLSAVMMSGSCSNVKTERPLTANEFLDLGEKYLLEMKYEQALVQFLKAIEVEPMNPRGYMGAADAYMGLNDIDSAVTILENGVRVVRDATDIQAVLDGILLSPSNEPESAAATVTESAAATVTESETSNAKLIEYDYSELSYNFDWNTDFWDEAIGGCTIDFDLNGYNDDILGVTLITWSEEINDKHFSALEERVSALKGTKTLSFSYTDNINVFEGHYHSVDPTPNKLEKLTTL